MTNISEIVNMLEAQGTDLKSWKEKQDSKFAELQNYAEQLEVKFNRQGLGKLADGAGGTTGVKHLVMRDGRKLPMLRSDQKSHDLYRGEESDFDLGEFCRDAIVGSTKAASGPALVPTYVGSQIIDAVRAQTVVVEAGAQTIVIDAPTNLARLTSDPTIYQHTEAATDISESDILAEPVTLNPKTLACLVPLTAELVQDSPNLGALLNVALAQAFAAKLDSLCLATLLADTDISESLATQDPALWLKVLEAVGSALALNQRLPSAHISSSADFIARAAQLETSGGWLGKPPVLAGMRELQTSGLSAGFAFFGNFAEAFAIAMRSELRVEVIRHQKPTSGSHLLVAHLRADGIVLQQGKLFRQLKTIV